MSIPATVERLTRCRDPLTEGAVMLLDLPSVVTQVLLTAIVAVGVVTGFALHRAHQGVSAPSEARSPRRDVLHVDSPTGTAGRQHSCKSGESVELPPGVMAVAAPEIEAATGIRPQPTYPRCFPCPLEWAAGTTGVGGGHDAFLDAVQATDKRSCRTCAAVTTNSPSTFRPLPGRRWLNSGYRTGSPRVIRVDGVAARAAAAAAGCRAC